MAEIHETHVERRRVRGGLFVVTFLVAALLGAAIVVVLMNVQGTLYWPAGQVTFNIRPTTPPAQQNPTTTVTLESTDTAPPITQDATPTDDTAPPETSIPTDEIPPATTPSEQTPTEQTQTQ